VVSKLTVKIDDKVIDAKIKEKEEAKQQYGDALAAGNTAVYAERDTKNDDALTLMIGNLPSGQSAVVDIQMIRPLKITESAFEFTFPVYFLP
jgi:Ca-activated chloride channel family protein